jgi:hypothetical protein
MRTLGLGGHWLSLDTIAIAQTRVVAVPLVTQFVPQPHVSSGVADQGGLAYGVPLVLPGQLAKLRLVRLPLVSRLNVWLRPYPAARHTERLRSLP